jgi:thiol-disulfide isomerase/thioredoxin
MKRILSITLPLALIGGCALLDADDDGLSNAEEEELGTDPEKADSDGDGLDDLDEVNAGTDPLEEDSDGDGLSDGDEVNDYGSDPLEIDTDGDGYEDSWEVTEGSDPADANSWIYAGGWPYNPDKDGPNIDDVDTDVDDMFAQISLMDQFGDEVDIHDFTGQGKYILVDISAVWCPPCNGLSEWISGASDSYGFGGVYPTVQEKVHNGEIYWITILGEDNYGDTPSLEVLEEWYEDYPDDKVPVLADTDDSNMANTYLEGGWPTVYLLDENGVIVAKPSNADYWAALDTADAL